MGKKSNSYLEQYRSPKWQKLRLEILERDEWTCQKCFDDESQLQVHHRKYIYGNKVWEYDESYLVTLCDKCHQVESKNMKGEMDVFVEILNKNLFSEQVLFLRDTLGYFLFMKKYPNKLFVDAVSWHILYHNENMVKSFLEFCKKEGFSRRYERTIKKGKS